MRVAVVDDRPESARDAASYLSEAGFVPVVLERPAGTLFQSPAELIAEIQRERCQATLSDHRLKERPFATFLGAELAAELYTRHLPSVLVSAFVDQDLGSIRKFRARIPSLLPRQNLDPELLREAFSRCEDELRGEPPPDRIARSAIVRAVALRKEDDDDLVDAFVHQWADDHAVSFPLDLVEDPRLRLWLQTELEKKGDVRLQAMVNLKAGGPADLFFHSFTQIPDNDSD